MNITILAAAGGIGDLVNQTAESFGCDIWMFLSQVISFVIVALLLKQFAYKPILRVLEERRQRIAEGLLNAEKIKQQLAEAEQRYQEILAKGNSEAQKMIDEARESAGVIAERKEQEAIASGGANHGQGPRGKRTRARAHDEPVEAGARPAGR